MHCCQLNNKMMDGRASFKSLSHGRRSHAVRGGNTHESRKGKVRLARQIDGGAPIMIGIGC